MSPSQGTGSGSSGRRDRPVDHGPVSDEEFAALRAELLTPEAERALRGGISQDLDAAEWRAVLDRVRSGLANLRDGEPVPRWVAARVDAALAEEAAIREAAIDGENPTSSAEAPTTSASARRHDRSGCAEVSRGLIEDLAPLTLVVIGFVYATPSGAAAEPIEVAAQALNVRDGALCHGWAWEGLIRPPAHAAPTLFDTQRTGITASMLAGRPPASQVLAELDGRFDTGPLLLVTHCAPATARLLFERRAHCPRLAGTDLLDTLRLALDRYPELPRHTLDEMATHLGVPFPRDGQRAMPDVQLTLEVLLTLIDRNIRWPDLRTLRAVAGYRARARRPDQGSLLE